jgi:hypothetical protein
MVIWYKLCCCPVLFQVLSMCFLTNLNFFNPLFMFCYNWFWCLVLYMSFLGAFLKHLNFLSLFISSNNISVWLGLGHLICSKHQPFLLCYWYNFKVDHIHSKLQDMCIYHIYGFHMLLVRMYEGLCIRCFGKFYQ